MKKESSTTAEEKKELNARSLLKTHLDIRPYLAMTFHTDEDVKQMGKEKALAKIEELKKAIEAI